MLDNCLLASLILLSFKTSDTEQSSLVMLQGRPERYLEFSGMHKVSMIPNSLINKRGYFVFMSRKEQIIPQFTWVCILLKNKSFAKISQRMYNI